jgi:hypothetical protein
LMLLLLRAAFFFFVKAIFLSFASGQNTIRFGRF